MACNCLRCVECRELVSRSFVKATQPDFDDAYCPDCYKRVFDWKHRLYWRIEARLNSLFNK